MSLEEGTELGTEWQKLDKSLRRYTTRNLRSLFLRKQKYLFLSRRIAVVRARGFARMLTILFQ